MKRYLKFEKIFFKKHSELKQIVLTVNKCRKHDYYECVYKQRLDGFYKLFCQYNLLKID